MHDNGRFCFPDMKSEGLNPTKDRIVINVGGNKHETHLNTLRNFPDTRLAWMAESHLTKGCHSSDDGSPIEYFFDRHPGVFVHILNYYRTGKLHCPSDVCGPVFEEELNFWGIDELQMEPCCWSTYTRHRDAQAFEKVFTINKNQDDQSDDGEQSCIGSTQHRGLWYSTYKQKIWDSLEKPYSSKGAQILALLSLLVIITSVVTFCLESMPQLHSYKQLFQFLDYSYCAVFTLDFLARVMSCPKLGEFFRSTLTWCDIMSVIPFYTNMIWTVNYLNVVLVVRLFRIFRLFRFFRFMSGMQVIGHTLKASARELMLLVLILLIPMVIFSSLLFYTEKAFDGDPRFYSIPHTFWWAVITMTTVGYGDIYPQTALGRLIGTMCACSGVLIVALPVSVIGSNFSLFYSYAQAQLRLPHKRKQPILVGAASALMSAIDPELTSSEGGSDLESGSGSESNLNDTGKPLLQNQSEKDFHVEVESIELACRSADEKKIYMQCTGPYGSLHSLGEKRKEPPFGNPGMSLGKGLKAMGDIMVNIATPTQRRMAISGVSLSHSPSLRRSNSGKRRSRSKSGDSLRRRTNTFASENFKDQGSNTSCHDQSLDGTPEQNTDMVIKDITDDVSSGNSHLHNSCSSLVGKSEDYSKDSKSMMTTCENNDFPDSQTTSGGAVMDGQDQRELDGTSDASCSEMHGCKHKENGAQYIADINQDEIAKHSDTQEKTSWVTDSENRETAEQNDCSKRSSWYAKTHTEPYGSVFPRFGKRRSATVNICKV